MKHPDKSLLGLGIQQPWAELILRGIKTIEVRTVPVAPKVVYIYASNKISTLPEAAVAAQDQQLDVESLHTGMIVGTIEIVSCRRSTPNDATAACVSTERLNNTFSWELQNPTRLSSPIIPKYTPYGMWFYPFQRKSE